MIDVSISRTSVDDLRKTARRLRAVGSSRAVRRELTKGLRLAARPVVQAQRVRVMLVEGAPSEWKADAARAVRVKVRTAGRSAGVAIVLKNTDAGRRGRHMNRGRWAHPLFGDRENWYRQIVQGGWFDIPAYAARPTVRRQVKRVLDDIERKAAG